MHLHFVELNLFLDNIFFYFKKHDCSVHLKKNKKVAKFKYKLQSKLLPNLSCCDLARDQQLRDLLIQFLSTLASQHNRLSVNVFRQHIKANITS